MSLFSRRSMMFVAGGALTLPLAAGTANAAFDIHGEGAAPVDEVSASVDTSMGHGGVDAGSDGARVNACATDAGPCATVRRSDIPVTPPQPLTDAAELAADADGVVTDQGRLAIEGSIRIPGEEIGGSADASTDGGSITFDTPIGDGSSEVEGESFDILVD